ncbi:MAG: tetratricopeptide repeat protein [Bacteroidales bacterium]|jgi:TolA-binding protein|nr:tetratricopeptide repeat protein [Bacteroidales bacterium]MCI1785794.1 tetratricopeptide repeat protein [Bacteroidales bacterium]
MKKMRLIAALAAVFISSGYYLPAQTSGSKEFDQAVNLYDSGFYERAMTLFESVSSKTADPVAEGYRVLCALKMKSEGCLSMSESYIVGNAESILIPQIRYQRSLFLFDRNDYDAASVEFSNVNENLLYSAQRHEFAFKKAYCSFENGDYVKALSGFKHVDGMPYSEYTDPSRYMTGFIYYSGKNFKKAYDWFGKSAKDPRFRDVSEYYMLECRFMLKDYDYVLNKGIDLYGSIPEDRKPHLARIISESYLVKGNAGKAKEYYEKIVPAKNNIGRKDYFYAGSVLYAVKDYKGSVDNFSMMTDRTDSLGQIANYHLGFSYIQMKNKVAAMGSFRDASETAFDPDIQEDAYFNYAKLAFDLNHDTSAFNEYLSRFSKEKNDKIYSYMALACLYDHDYAGAVAAYDNIDELDDDMKANYIKANYLRAVQLISNGSYRDAVSCLRASAYYSDIHDPFNQLARYWLAESYYRSDRFADAVSVFKDLYNLSALDSHIEGNLIPYDMAYCYFKEKDYDTAAEWYEKYLNTAGPEYGADASLRRADCSFVKKDYKDAIDWYEKAVNDYGSSNDLYPYFRIGVSYGLEGNKEKKIEYLSRVMDSKPSEPYYDETIYELGRAYVSDNSDDKAVLCFETLKANTRDSSYIAKSLIELGMIARNKSDYDRALSYYKQVAGGMRNSEYRDDALLAIESIYQAKGEPDVYLDYADSIGADADKSEIEKENAYFNSAEQIFLSENYRKALTALLNYESKYPKGGNVSHADFYIAECYKNLGRKEKACDYYEKVINGGATGSFAELAMLNFANLSYSMEHYSDAFRGYNSLLDSARIENNKFTAELGMMRSAYMGHDYANALSWAEKVGKDNRSSSDQIRESDYIRAKSYLATSSRKAAFDIFERLSAYPETEEGAEASYLVIQATYDKGDFDDVETKVYKFADNAGDRTYWLAKSFVVLGDSFVERNNYTQAKATFESILKDYKPDAGHPDDIVDNVKIRLAKLQKLINEK